MVLGQHHPDSVILPGPKGSWNNIKINDPCPLVFNDEILIYYKGVPIERGHEMVLRMQGVSKIERSAWSVYSFTD